MKILMVLPRVPYPLEKGDKLRAFNQLKGLHALGHEIYLFCVSHERVDETVLQAVRPYCREVYVQRLSKGGSLLRAVFAFFRCRSLQVAYWNNAKTKRAIRTMERRVAPDVVYNQMVRTAPLAMQSQAAKVMDFQDTLSLNMLRLMRQYEVSVPDGKGVQKCKAPSFYRHKPSLKYFIYHYEFKMLRQWENRAVDAFDALTVISEPDRNALPHKARGGVHIVSNGVDMDYFCPREQEQQYDVAFCGNMQYEPNVRTACYLAKEVMPIVREQRPGTTLLLAGATPTAAVRALASDTVTVTGTVADIRDCYANTKVFAAPMQCGSGLQNKLLEAMSMAVPCVTSSIANAALGAAAEGQEVWVGDTPERVAEHISFLLQSRQQRDIMADNARQFVRRHYSWEQANRTLSDILQDAAKKHNAQ